MLVVPAVELIYRHLAVKPKHPKARQSLAWTNWPLFTLGLVQRGYPDDAIRKILGQNMLRVARAALG